MYEIWPNHFAPSLNIRVCELSKGLRIYISNGSTIGAHDVHITFTNRASSFPFGSYSMHNVFNLHHPFEVYMKYQ